MTLATAAVSNRMDNLRPKTYTVKSVFLTLQGEGLNAGRPAVFCRFAGCNLWNGREEDRANATCRFCDTDFVGVDGPGGGRYRTSRALADAILALWPADAGRPFVVFTGGEPTLQLDTSLVEELRLGDAEIAIETNGTRLVPEGIDWVCVSPKAETPLRQRSGDELKVAWPQRGMSLAELEVLPFSHHLLQPIDGPDYAANARAVIRACLERPTWQLSLQYHKLLGIP